MAPAPRIAVAVCCLLFVVVADPSGARADAPFAASPTSSSTAPAAFAPVAVAGGGFGVVGQWVVSVQSANDVSASLSLRNSSGGGWGFLVRPAADTFLTSNVSVGGTVGLGHGGGTTTFEIGARAGYDLNISDQVGFWPTAGILFGYWNGNHASDASGTLVVFAPFLYHLAPHFFVGLGPTFNFLFAGGDGHDYGLDFIIGGWL